jgi:UrcA family protein
MAGSKEIQMTEINTKGSRVTHPLQKMMLVTMGLAGVTMASVAGARIVDTERETVSIKVQYGDLNLATAEGKNVLKRRIHHAADVVCGEPDARDLVNSVVYKECMNSATNAAWAQVNWPQPQG